ncbi:MAG: FAD-dependent oxidoreductase [Anaerolineae bacterium]|jgi:nitrite reductase (NADH) large subunit
MQHVIIGNGVAGVTAAAELSDREAGQIEVYAAEPYPYYFRPQLPRFLGGGVSRERLIARSPSWYEERDIVVHLDTPVARLLPDEKRIVLEDGSKVAYDRLLLATGGLPFIPPIEGQGKEGVFTLRTLEDALAIKAYAPRCEQAVVIGGGLLGLESARGLQGLGLSVTALEFFPRLLPRQLDDEGAAVFRKMVEDLDIGVAVGANTKAILGDGAVERVVLQDGREFPAQLVLVATGMRCNAELAAEAGLTVDRGVVVDDHLRTSAPDVYAAGDVASFHGRSWGIIPQAREQAAVAAANMAGDDAVYEEIVPSTTLRIAGIHLTSCGKEPSSEGESWTAYRQEDPGAGVYRKLALEEDVAVQAIVIGDRALARELEALVTQRARVSREEAYDLLSIE